ncbi:MAG: sulfide/dihydroorotate dehydrogenase-like FAD/NAD-binding protein [Candidatus Omnitrophica bacterium]|nr:sulfide/dihydroorotate dehydrogenase-like FAD/NAD-binding protein [Candidatus Omnitrophota bacterium]MDD5436112.1 sulfide/dihydroorotate dehydrogenase-like FAD/NAD-binding protein [Candidatus Omnitrophota bacterium]
MPYKITEKVRLNPVTWKLVLEAPLIARQAKAGQFVIIKIDEKAERIPLTINDNDPQKNTITIIFQEAGATTRRLGCLKAGDVLTDILGPLGKETDFGKAGRVVLVAGGVGIAEILPVAKYAKREGNYVLTIIGSRTKDLLILEEELKRYSDKLIVTTDDGSYGVKGLVVSPLKEAMASEKLDLCYCVGPDIMMKAVSETTKPCGLKTLVSLDANMVDATGMCGTCRVTVGGKTRFVCVDGPEFDGHLVEWDLFLKRQKRFIEEEKRAAEYFESHHKDCIYKR